MPVNTYGARNDSDIVHFYSLLIPFSTTGVAGRYMASGKGGRQRSPSSPGEQTGSLPMQLPQSHISEPVGPSNLPSATPEKLNQARILFSLNDTCNANIPFVPEGDFSVILDQAHGIQQPNWCHFRKNLIGAQKTACSVHRDISTEKHTPHPGRLSHDVQGDRDLSISPGLPRGPTSVSTELTTSYLLSTWNVMTSTEDLNFCLF